MAQWTVNRLVRMGAGSAAGRFALRVARDLGDLELFDRGMTLAAHAFTSVLPILIVAGALRAELAPEDGAILAEHLGLNHATAEVAGVVGRLVLPDVLASSAQRFGVLGMAFSYVGWLFSLMCVLLVAATVGRVVHVTTSGQAWRYSVMVGRSVVGVRRRERDRNQVADSSTE